MKRGTDVPCVALVLMAALTLVAAPRARAGAVAAGPDLRDLALRAAPDGETLLLDVDHGVEPRVTAVETPRDALVRLYVDLPPGSRAAPGLGRGLRGDPIAAARVGLGDDGGVRVVVEVAGASGWRLDREAGGIFALTVRRTAVASMARATPRLPAAVPPATAPSPVALRPRIVLDPGHGGADAGATGAVVEKEVTLDVAARVATLLRARLAADVVLTRTADETLALSARTARANREDADLFVSIHANANPSGTLHGIETYVLDDTSDHAVLRLASMENGLDMLHPPADRRDARYILSDLVQGAKMDESVALASAIQDEVVRSVRGQHADVADLGVKRGPFYVLVGAYMPCVLVETSFVSHPLEGRRLADPAYRAALAEGITRGIVRFLGDGVRARTL